MKQKLLEVKTLGSWICYCGRGELYPGMAGYGDGGGVGVGVVGGGVGGGEDEPRWISCMRSNLI